MSSNRHAHNELIDRLGAKVVSDRFGLKPQRLHNWRVRGVPHSCRVKFAKVAAEHGVTVPEAFFEQADA